MYSNPGLFVGLCLPNQCTTSIINQTLGIFFSSAKLPYKVDSIQSNIQDFDFGYSPLFYITIIILAIFLLLTLTATVLYRKNIGHLKKFAFQETVKVFEIK